MAKKPKKLNIRAEINQEEAVKFKEAILILLSVAFGIGYVDVHQLYLTDMYFLIGLQLFFVSTGLIAVYLINDVKSEFEDHLGSYQELFYYFTHDRSFIYILSAQYTILLVLICSFAMYFVCSHLAMILTALLQENREFRTFGLLYIAIVFLLCFTVVLPSSYFLNFQKFKRLTKILIGSLTLAVILLGIQMLICLFRMDADSAKFERLYQELMNETKCSSFYKS